MTSRYSKYWGTVYNTLSGAIAVSGIYSDFPNIGRNTFKGYPILTIESPNISNLGVGIGSSRLREYSVDFDINIFDKRLATIDVVAGSVMDVLQDAEKWTVSGTAASGLMFGNITSSTTTWGSPERSKDFMYTKTLSVSYTVVE